MVAPLVKVVVVGVIVGILALSGSSSPPKRAPYKLPIKVPPNDIPWDSVDEAICFCHEAGEKELADLTRCALTRLYPEVGWPAIAGDDPTVVRAQAAVTARVAGVFLPALLRFAQGKGPDPCAQVKPDEPKTEPKATPSEIIELIRDAPESFLAITQHHNQNPSYAAAAAYKLNSNSANVGRAVVAMSNVGYNLLLYSRKRKASDYGAARVIGGQGGAGYYDIGPAWDPENARMLGASESGERLHRWVNWAGTKAAPNGDHAYGNPWTPPMVMQAGVLVQVNKDPWAPENNPPAKVLAALGWTLEEMRAAWLANNP